MQPEAIFDQYYLYATESNRILESYNASVQQLQNDYLKLELIYLHKNISFIFKKLITVFCNQKLWNNVANPCLQEGYEPSKELTIARELEFLNRYKSQIIGQLKCIHNTTVFETDVQFLAKCFTMLQAAYQKVENRLETVMKFMAQSYLIAS